MEEGNNQGKKIEREGEEGVAPDKRCNLVFVEQETTSVSV